MVKIFSSVALFAIIASFCVLSSPSCTKGGLVFVSAIRFPKAEAETAESILSATRAVEQKTTAMIAKANKKWPDATSSAGELIKKRNVYQQHLLKRNSTFSNVKPAMTSISDGGDASTKESLQLALRYTPRIFTMASPSWYYVKPEGAALDPEELYVGRRSEFYDAVWVEQLTTEQGGRFIPKVTLEGFTTGIHTDVFELESVEMTTQLVSVIEKLLFPPPPPPPVQQECGGGGGDGSDAMPRKSTTATATQPSHISGIVLDWGPLELTKLALQSGAERLLRELRAMLERNIPGGDGDGNEAPLVAPVLILEITASYIELSPKELVWLAPLVDHMVIATQESIDQDRHRWQNPVDWLRIVLAGLEVHSWHQGGVSISSAATTPADVKNEKKNENLSSPAPGKFLATINFGGLTKVNSMPFQPFSGTQYLEVLAKRSPKLKWDTSKKEHLLEVYLPGQGMTSIFYPTRASLLHKFALLEAFGCGVNVMGLSDGLDIFYHQL